MTSAECEEGQTSFDDLELLAQNALRLELRPSLLLPRNPDDWHKRFVAPRAPAARVGGTNASGGRS